MRAEIWILAIALVVAPGAAAEPIAKTEEEDGTHYTGVATPVSEDQRTDWELAPGGCVQVITTFEYTFTVDPGVPGSLVELTLTTVSEGTFAERTLQAAPGETKTVTVDHPSACESFVVEPARPGTLAVYEVVAEQV